VTDSRIALDLGWKDLDHHVAVLAQQIRQDGVPHVVVGILRGGLIPAVMLAHRLGVRDVRAVEVTHTTSDVPNAAKSARPMVANPASLGSVDDADVLLVDDVAGSGQTAATAVELIAPSAGRLRRAVVVVNTTNWFAASTQEPHQVHNYLATTCTGWVRFPWETL